MTKHLIAIIIIIVGTSAFIKAQTTIKVSIKQPEQLSVNLSADATILKGENIVLGDQPLVIGGTPEYNYSWTPLEGLDNPIISNPLANPTDTTTYYLSVIDAKGCTISDSIVINVAVATNIDLLKDSELKVYPNPSPTGIFTLSYFGGEKTISISITSFDGKAVIQNQKIFPASKTIIDLSESPGINIIRFEVNRQSFSKIIINSLSR